MPAGTRARLVGLEATGIYFPASLSGLRASDLLIECVCQLTSAIPPPQTNRHTRTLIYNTVFKESVKIHLDAGPVSKKYP